MNRPSKKRSIRPPPRFQNYEMMSSWFEENSTEPPQESSKKPLEINSKSAQKEVGFVISENEQNGSSDHQILETTSDSDLKDDTVSQNVFKK